MKPNSSFILQVLEDQCSGCGICAGSCTYSAITFTDMPVIDPLACRLCGSCVQSCPSGALVMQEPEAIIAQTSQDVTSGIWVLAEVENKQLESVTKELLGKACELSQKLLCDVEAVLIGKDVSDLSQELIAYGADRVHIIEDDELESFIDENYARVLADLARKFRPEILLVGATARGRGLSARLAAILQTGLTADCTDLDIDEHTGLLFQIRPAFGGNLMATIATPNHRPQMASVRPGVMQAREACERDGEMIRHDDLMISPDKRVRVVREIRELVEADSPVNSRIVVGIGRGVKNKESLTAIRHWAKQIGAVVTGSRAAVEAGLIDAQMQVGQTGHSIAPDLYIAIGISGQIQHTAAVSGAKKIIAINPDRSAPIFNMADYGWAIPVEEVIPSLMAGSK